jgi:hypothetical protein
MVETKHSGYFYLAAPFTHTDPKVERIRYEQALAATATLMLRGYQIFSPISHSIPLTDPRFELPKSNEFWLTQDKPLLMASEGLILLKLPGWETSKGVAQEILWADEHRIEIYEFHEFLNEGAR